MKINQRTVITFLIIITSASNSISYAQSYKRSLGFNARNFLGSNDRTAVFRNKVGEHKNYRIDFGLSRFTIDNPSNSYSDSIDVPEEYQKGMQTYLNSSIAFSIEKTRLIKGELWWYTGPFLGLSFFLNDQEHVENIADGTGNLVKQKVQSTSFNLGYRAGITYHLFERLSISTEISIRGFYSMDVSEFKLTTVDFNNSSNLKVLRSTSGTSNDFGLVFNPLQMLMLSYHF